MSHLFIALWLSWTAQAGTFRFHLLAEPHTMDPQSTASLSGNYLFQNLYRGLFRYDSRKGLQKEGAKDCARARLSLVCHLNPAQKWSDGTAIKASDYVTAFRRLIDPERRSPQSELLLTLKNAKEILDGKKTAASLGVFALNDSTLKFEFSSADPEFEYKLINPALAPWPPAGILPREQSAKMVFSGPYKIAEWKVGHYARAVKNPFYGLSSNPTRPDVESYFLESDNTALGLYEDGKLSFLRRLPVSDLNRYRKSPEFLQRPMARLEYLGFGPELMDHPNLREALALSIDFEKFKMLVDSASLPGCPSLSPEWMDRTRCLKFDPARAKSLLKKEKKLPPLVFYFSLMGGDDLKRTAEWFQDQWKKNLGLNIEMRSEEQLVYLGHLRTNPPAIFRKGVGLDRPTCLAAMELFSEGSRENYIRLKDAKFEKMVENLSAAESANERRRACREADEFLIGSHRLIPLGQMFFFMLMKPRFKGWDLNQVNQLDLANLTEVR